MYRDLAKTAGTTLVLLVLVVIAVAAGMLIREWMTDGPSLVTGPAVLEAIDHVNKQIFIEHYLVVDVYHTDAPDVLPELLTKLGIRQEFVVLIRGRVPAGFDLQRLNKSHIWTSADGKRVQFILPAPTVFKDNVSIDFENSRILTRKDTCPSVLCEDELVVYQNEVLPRAKDILIERALQNGILEQTARDGKVFYEQFLISLGFEEADVIVTGYGF